MNLVAQHVWKQGDAVTGNAELLTKVVMAFTDPVITVIYIRTGQIKHGRPYPTLVALTQKTQHRPTVILPVVIEITESWCGVLQNHHIRIMLRDNLRKKITGVIRLHAAEAGLKYCNFRLEFKFCLCFPDITGLFGRDTISQNQNFHMIP